MRKTMVLFLLGLTALPLFAQQPCNPEKPDCKATVDQALNFYRGANMVEKAVVNTNKPTTPPDAFAGHVHNSYQDFLNLFAFAINDVQESENGQALVVRFNPLREGNNLLGLTLTVAKPVVADAVKNAIPAGTRDTTVAAVEKKLSDLDDRTWSGSYSFATAECSAQQKDLKKRCWGRQPKAYRELLAPLVPEPAETDDIQALGDLGERLAKLYTEEGEVGGFLVRSATDPDLALKLIQQIAAAEKGSVEAAVKELTDLHLDLLPALIDNQPQITGSATYHERGRFSGANERAATLEFHVGRNNINTLRESCAQANDLGTCFEQRLKRFADTGLSTDKYVATFTYKKTNEYKLSDLGLTPAVEGFTAVKLPSASQYNIKVQAGRELSSQVARKNARADLSFEGIRTEDDGVRTKNRWVGTITLSVPFGDRMTMPVSLTYANKAEFLDEKDKHLSAHFGLSYRLPNLFGSQ
jgi:hypothetical protein